MAYARRVERLVGFGGNENYEAAYRLIARMQAIRKRNDETAAHADYISDLMSRHKFKRNFMKLLQTKGNLRPTAS
jgi:uncharacterized Zn finger protein